ncbi:MAG: hypothetical protein MK033_12810 [Candidatus Caenarcaniphilales bacterium]|nr:hypothetical protein [Candidatus Caenarcaniphilales bacterium]
MFESSELEEKRELIQLTLQNLRIDDEKIAYDWVEPFDAIFNCTRRQEWLPVIDSIRTDIEATPKFVFDHIEEIVSKNYDEIALKRA